MPRSGRKGWILLLFGLYCIGMLWLLFFQRIGGYVSPRRYNLHPLDTVSRYLWVLKYSLDPTQQFHAIANLAGNVILFLPLGIFLPMSFVRLRAFWRFALAALLAILAVEALQLFTGLGALDVDDLILNLMGIALGYLLWQGSRSDPQKM